MFGIFNKKSKGLKSKNSVNTISVYWKSGTWVFDDDTVGLVEEPFVAGADKIISEALESKGQFEIALNDGGANIVFSSTEFPDYDVHLVKKFNVGHGMYLARYKDTTLARYGWLCPATLHYFEDYPDNIYAKVTACNAKLEGY